MATPVMMPKVGISVESCVITKWHKAKGDAVKVGDLLFTYETDKSTIDEEATVEGTMLGHFFEEGDDVPCMTNVCVIGTEGESIDEFKPAVEEEDAPAAPEAPAAETPAAQSAPVSAAPAAVPADGRLKISPRARLLAEKAGVDPKYAAATGAEGRICEADIRALIANPPVMAEPATAAETVAAPVPAYRDEKLSGIRKAIAKSMFTSLSTMAQLTHNTSFDATEILAFRKKIKANAEAMGLSNITLNDIILFAVARTLKHYPMLNAHMLDDTTMRFFSGVHLGVAVDTERGLMVPTIFDADKKSLNEISLEAKALAKECQAGSINPDKLQGASFTVSNLGSFGIESFTPVINPPQVGILGVDTLMTRVRDVDGTAVPYQAMGLSLTYDHRAVDGGPASKFLRELGRNLENFSLLMIQ